MLRALFEQSARVLRYAVALLTLAGPAAPTWSIVCVNMENLPQSLAKFVEFRKAPQGLIYTTAC